MIPPFFIFQFKSRALWSRLMVMAVLGSLLLTHRVEARYKEPILPIGPVANAAIPFSGTRYSVEAKGESLTELLESFCSSQDINLATLDESLETEVNGRFGNEGTTPQDFLNLLTQAYNLTWFYDGNILTIGSRRDIVSEYIELLDPRSANRIHSVMQQLGFACSSFKLSFLENPSFIYASGPKSFVDSIRKLSSMELGSYERSQGRSSYRRFKLKHAYPYDVNISYQGNELLIPGVVTLLNKIMNGGDVPGEAADGVSKTVLSAAARRLSNVGAPDPGTSSAKPSNAMQRNSPNPAMMGMPAMGGAGNSSDGEEAKSAQIMAPIITADMRTNSIFITDTEDRMPLYEELIEDLDQPQKLIAITAAIVDVDVNYTHELGVEFGSTVHNPADKNQFSLYGSPSNEGANPALTGTATLPIGSTTSSNLAANWIKIPNNRAFLAGIKALSKDNHAKLLSRPHVVTFNNLKCTVSTGSTEYISVSGDRAVDLFDVTANTSLEVTPSIVEHSKGSGRSVRVLVSIRDASAQQTQQGVNPKITESFINTQGVIAENESLLIGGYYRETKQNLETGLPVLSKVPFLGAVFRTRQKVRQTNQRMYLISPHIIDLNELENGDLDEYFEKNNRYYLGPEERRDAQRLAKAEAAQAQDTALDGSTRKSSQKRHDQALTTSKLWAKKEEIAIQVDDVLPHDESTPKDPLEAFLCKTTKRHLKQKDARIQLSAGREAGLNPSTSMASQLMKGPHAQASARASKNRPQGPLHAKLQAWARQSLGAIRSQYKGQASLKQINFPKKASTPKPQSAPRSQKSASTQGLTGKALPLNAQARTSSKRAAVQSPQLKQSLQGKQAAQKKVTQSPSLKAKPPAAPASPKTNKPGIKKQSQLANKNQPQLSNSPQRKLINKPQLQPVKESNAQPATNNQYQLAAKNQPQLSNSLQQKLINKPQLQPVKESNAQPVTNNQSQLAANNQAKAAIKHKPNSASHFSNKERTAQPNKLSNTAAKALAAQTKHPKPQTDLRPLNAGSVSGSGHAAKASRPNAKAALPASNPKTVPHRATETEEKPKMVDVFRETDPDFDLSNWDLSGIE